MRVEYSLPVDGIEADVVVLDTDGNPLDVKIGQIIIEPYFYAADGSPVTLHAKTKTMEDKEIQRCNIVISGVTGKLRSDDRTGRVPPRYYRCKEKEITSKSTGKK